MKGKILFQRKISLVEDKISKQLDPQKLCLKLNILFYKTSSDTILK